MTSIALLLVEDDPLVANLSRTMLEEDGYSVLLACNGYEALSLLNEQGDAFVAVVTDVRLGAGPNGWDVGRHARALQPAMPVLYVTGDSSADWHANGVAGSGLLTKPFPGAQLISSVDALVNGLRTLQ